MTETPRFTPIGRGKIAAIATRLEMRERPAARPEPDGLDGEVVSLEGISVDRYLDLFRRIGTDHLWLTRLLMAREDLEGLLAAPGTRLLGERVDGRLEGLAELDLSQGEGVCEIKYFGVTAARQGTGSARRLMNHAVAAAFDAGARRLWLHTNTMDHPRAMAFYGRSGFTPIGQEVEINDDPRLTGHLPRDAAPHVPIFE
ncbi:GNAT family N-acetyltransferase [Aureimonas flava]|uniref:GNAT family N-acetyltransferase n=1 Tax=Aureimonas flava TaxID=2320271 RepID=A0A3A1WM64_9HYPH|nr:GNAT family N-acetyltransferase [Aureimonas flava]RIY02646.1 GNAT family N-acetyltransferase [Aureimonas flava]